MKKISGYINGITVHDNSHVIRGSITSLGLDAPTVDQLLKSGFKDYCKFSTDKYDVINSVATQCIINSGKNADEIDMILISSAFGDGHKIGNGREEIIEDYFRYTGMRLQYDLSASKATVLGLSQLGCISMHATVDLAVKLLSDQVKNILCVSYDHVPDSVGRYVLHSVVSDACGACMVSREVTGPSFKYMSFAQKSNGYYWDPRETQDRLEAAYYPTSVRVMKRAVSSLGYTISDISHIMPNNVSRESWEILSKTCNIPMEKIWLSTLAEYGHTASIDSFINTKYCLDNQALRNGDSVMLFGFGFGAHWCAMLMEYEDNDR